MRRGKTMLQETRLTYPPLNTLKPIADDVWIVDGPGQAELRRAFRWILDR